MVNDEQVPWSDDGSPAPANQPDHAPTPPDDGNPVCGDEAYVLDDGEFDHEQREANVRPGADREPTGDEEAAAERVAKDVDVDSVREHYTEMQEIGVAVRGEGEIPES